MITLALAIGLLWNQTATLHDGKCSVCERFHMISRVYMNGYLECTLMACAQGHYDKKGNFVQPLPCNTCSTYGRCTNGHRVVISTKL